MENYNMSDKIVKEKLLAFFDIRLKSLEERSLNHLKDLEALKYQSYILLNSSKN